ncbi:hypothetical protein [Thioflexithrix psekupsensis]|uniref:Uncharacterized protein n=1 Tax=Thioflexithrix psekupsensis TaxID=1570016 RepID=A0A251X530_9GAMM|nr:hypothetical protein [Thioflexithrix psekupsensis]OUD12465.1 hypothetical protein TPSD3_15270 [Thioflexithrix psekupsensis]
MKNLVTNPELFGAEDVSDLTVSKELQAQKLAELQAKLTHHPRGQTRGNLLIEYGYVCLSLEQDEEAWQAAREAFDIHVAYSEWENAVHACNIMFQANQADSLVALGNGVWLAVTFPIDTELSVLMLENIVNETPDNSDGAAVAAATAHYLVDLRTEGRQRDDLHFFTNQLLARVARRHSGIETNVGFQMWMQRLGLDDPDAFLNRLAQVLNIITQNEWWVDRDHIRETLPSLH